MARSRKIEALTPGQERQLVAYREEWLAHGRSCAPADRPATEAVIRAMYAAIGEPAPGFWWIDGPATGSLVRAVLSNTLGANLRANLGANLRDHLWANLGDNLGANLRDHLWANLGDNLRDHLWANLGAHLWANLGDNLRDHLWANLGAHLWANLGANLRANLGAHLWANLGANLRANLGDHLGWYFWGQHEAAWPAHYAWPDLALRPMHTPEQRERLGWWLTLARSCGWWQPYKGLVFVCERPARQAVDAQGRLHHESDPALLCRDGFGVYAWHGTRVPAWVIEQPDTITADHITQEANAEVRRVLLARFGADRYVQALGVPATDTVTTPLGAEELYRIPRPDDSDLVLARVINSTPEPLASPPSGDHVQDGNRWWKRYWLRVHPDCRTVQEAKAWSFGLEPGAYAPEVET